MISYAQNAEDVVLARAMPESAGVYVDVGAASPTLHSVTKAFYDLGWHGMNIDPLTRWWVELQSVRSRDINLCVGVSDADGVLDLYDASGHAAEQATFAPEVAARLEGAGKPSVVLPVPVRTLASLLDEYDLGPIDFLKIDAEGWEQQVIRGNDWRRHRPKVVVVEATEPETSIPAHESWEPILIDAGYALCLFDGLNRFYALATESELIDRLSAPASALDKFERFEVVELRDQVMALDTELETRSETADRQLKAALARAKEAEARVGLLEREVRRLEVTIGTTAEEVRRAVVRADDADAQFRAVRLALEAIIRPG